ncbi:hypothetical protein ACWEQL_20290 [Kitasatospora sp. NPDC004240]
MNGTASTLDAIEDSARQAAISRAHGLRGAAPTFDPSILAATSEREGMAAVLRHRLQLPAGLRLGVYEDINHPLFPGAALSRAARVQLSFGRRGHIFLGTYQDARLTFSLVAPCRACSSRVPSARVDSLADFGDWLLGGMDRAIESALFRTSPVHRSSCPLAAA